MIYNKHSSSKTLTNVLPYNENSHQNDITRQINVITEIDKTNYTPFTSFSINKKRVRREMRRIKRKERKVSYFAVISSSLFSLAVACCVLYLAYNKIYAPEGVYSLVSNVIEVFFDSTEATDTIVMSRSHSSNSIPVYLSSFETFSSPIQNSSPSVVAASGEQGIQNNIIPESSNNSVNASNDTGGKSGSDGKIYYSIACSNLANDNLLALSNQTKLSPDMLMLSDKKPKAYENIKLSNEPLVLILHTHATECYTSSSDGKYEKNEPTRSDDKSKNVVAVGKALADTLESFGIPVLHSKTLHDKESFINAYTSSLNEAHALLKQYPSIKFVIDLHRDSIVSNDGSKTAPTAVIAGQNYAQLMFVIGTNEAGFKHPDWQDNLCFALDIQKSVNEMYPHLMRPINLRSVSFNEQLSNGYVLLETGSCANTLSEAKRSAEAFGSILAKRILENAKAT